MIITGDCLEKLREMDNESIDLVCTDPPYGYSFMGKDWDKAVPSVEIWQECLRVLKPGAFCFVMSAPRSDVQNAMISRLMEAGFRLDFTPIYWTYATGFPKAGNVGKLVDKRLGAEREVTGKQRQRSLTGSNNGWKSDVSYEGQTEIDITAPKSDQAKALDGSYAGFQPKPAVEVIIVAMKPLSEKTYVDQALKNGKGITWLDDCRVPTTEKWTPHIADDIRGGNLINTETKNHPTLIKQPHDGGRFPANLLVSDDVLNGETEYSRYFDLDKWATTLPFLIVPKASKREKNEGVIDKNHHPTVKPLKLMSYLITLFTRPGDKVLDPFVGSGTTVVAAKKLDRQGIGIEREQEYAEIAQARIDFENKQVKQEQLL